MAINSKNKGREGERSLSKALNEYGFDTRRGAQYCGLHGDADVVGLPHIHIECKRVERLNIDDALNQAKRDARDDELPVVMHRKNGTSWKVTQDLGTWMMMYKAWLKSQEMEEVKK